MKKNKFNKEKKLLEERRKEGSGMECVSGGLYYLILIPT